MQQDAFLIELIGPAGAGKSSLLRELRRQHPTLPLFADRLRVREPQNLPFYLRSSAAALPALLPLLWRSPRQAAQQGLWQERWYTKGEISRMLYLVGMHRVFQKHAQRHGLIVVDQGPIFELTHLRAFGSAQLHSHAYVPWWHGLYQRWARLFKLVVWLDAPDEVLIPRVRRREQAHAIKYYSEADARALLARYRHAFTNVMEQLQHRATIPVLSFTTTHMSVEEVAQRLLQKLEQITHVDSVEKSS